MHEHYGHQSDQLDKHAWKIWVSIVSISVLITVGLGSLFILNNEKIQSLYPWAGTDRVLMGGLTLLVLCFALYLTNQQRKLINVRRSLVAAKQATDERLARHVHHLEAILQISHIMASETSDQPVYDAIVEGCLDVFECDRASLMLLDHTTADLVVRSARGHDDTSVVLGARVSIGEGVAGRVAESRQPLIIEGNANPSAFEALQEKLNAPQASMVVPILMRGEILGVISVSSQKNIKFQQEDLQALNVFAEHAGVCCRHTQQSQWMRETIQRLDKDLDDFRHSRRAA